MRLESSPKVGRNPHRPDYRTETEAGVSARQAIDLLVASSGSGYSADPDVAVSMGSKPLVSRKQVRGSGGASPDR